ncbi:glycosyltransferase [Amycolatopsis benzoatilytica]|uniref:glycosyltransferase n=1 Tax=Amycolatopsis benzoatilytica TaxID=346045 RepID=UPI0004864A00|nr:glycosyltransferase [Amycolatopsis benzoatilytica]
MNPRAHVVIPAHNEERTLPRLLRALAAGASPGELEIVVVASACTDRTAAVAEAAGVTVFETADPGKVTALRLGDEVLTGFPRLYVDADVVLSVNAVRALVAALDTPDIVMATPLPQLELDGVGPIAARAHRAWAHLPSVRRSGVGSGVYALDRRGHALAFPLPDVLADDAWVHRVIPAAQKTVVAEARAAVWPAATVRALVRRRARVRLGNRQLDRLGRPAAAGDSTGPRTLARLVRGGTVSAADAACFTVVVLADRAIAWFRRIRGNESEWSTDNTTRPSTEPELRAQ